MSPAIRSVVISLSCFLLVVLYFGAIVFSFKLWLYYENGSNARCCGNLNKDLSTLILFP